MNSWLYNAWRNHRDEKIDKDFPTLQETLGRKELEAWRVARPRLCVNKLTTFLPLLTQFCSWIKKAEMYDMIYQRIRYDDFNNPFGC